MIDPLKEELWEFGRESKAVRAVRAVSESCDSIPKRHQRLAVEALCLLRSPRNPTSADRDMGRVHDVVSGEAVSNA